MKEIKRFANQLEEIIKESDNLSSLFLIWKKVGNRVSNEDYISSKQQVRKKNPSNQDLLKIFCVESIIALILWCLSLVKFKKISYHRFQNINFILKTFQENKNSEISFLFDYEIYNIWKDIDESKKNSKIDQVISHLLPSILNDLKEKPIKEIFLHLHQKFLDIESRKLFGEFYTSLELSKIIVNNAYKHTRNYNRIIDLSCGSAILLIEFYEVLKKEGKDHILNSLVGIDLNPIATLISKFTLFFTEYDTNSKLTEISEPLIFCADSLVSFIHPQNEEYKFNIEFLGEEFDISIKNINSFNIFMFRSYCKGELEKLFGNIVSDIKIPQKLKEIIEKSNLKQYLMTLLIERMCAVFSLNQKYDLVLGNPPYMRIQSIHPIWKRDIYSKNYISATGHFDIYYLFIELGCKILSNQGCLAYITSNKFIKTSSGASIRQFILKNMQFRCLIDFEDSHVFNAMVLPLVFILTKGAQKESFSFTSIKKVKNDSYEIHSKNELIDVLCDDRNTEINQKIWKISSDKLIKITRFPLEQPAMTFNIWSFLNPKISDVIKEIDKKKNNRLSDICEKIIVGIKTTANYAFIDDFSYDFINQEEILKERSSIKEKYGIDIFYPLIKGKYIRDFKITLKLENSKEKFKSYIFYPHYKNQDMNKIIPIPEEDIPLMIEYFRNHGYDKKLAKREYIKNAKRKWYEIWNHKDPDDMRRRKIVVPDISPKNNFAVDYNGNYVDGSAYFMLLKDDSIENLKYIAAILNSSLNEFYHKVTSGNTLYARRYRYWSSNIKNLPIIPMEKCNSTLKEKIITSISSIEKKYSKKKEEEISNLVFNLFEIQEENRHFIKKWVNDNRINK